MHVNGLRPGTPRKRGGGVILPASSDGRESDPGGSYGDVPSNAKFLVEDEVEIDSEPIICQVRSQSMFKVPLRLHTKAVDAIVDTAAEVTIISDRVYNSLSAPCRILKKVILNTAGRELKMNGFIVGPIRVTLGTQQFDENIYVAPIQDDMLLGLDFLRRHQALIDIPHSSIQIGEERIPMSSEMSGDLSVSKVVVTKTTVVPPNTVVRVPCTVDEEVSRGVFMVEGVEDLKVLIPDSVFFDSPVVQLSVVNLADKYHTLCQSDCVAQAQPVKLVPPVPPEL